MLTSLSRAVPSRRSTPRTLLTCLVAAVAFTTPMYAVALPQAASAATVADAKPAPFTLYPLEVKLIHSFDAASLKAGDHLLTKLAHNWTDGECNLPAGTAISADIIGVHEWTPADKQTRVTLQFRYSCADGTHLLRLVTLLAPENPDLLGIHGNPVAMQAMRSSLFGEGDYTRSAGNTINNHVDMSGQQNPQLPLFIDSEPNPEHRPTQAKRGLVWHLPGVALSLNDGEPPDTAIFSSHRSLKLPSETVFVLQSELPREQRLLAASGSPDSQPLPPSRRQLPALAAEITACPATTCSDVPTTAPPQIKPQQEISLRNYGSVHTRTGEIAGLDHDAAIAFLGSDELLVCVGKPGLMPRLRDKRPEDHPHYVEAVLYNRRTAQIERTEEWVVPNRDRYLWPLNDGRVLVHTGNNLTWFGPGLTVEHTMPLHAPLAFVHTTAQGDRLLVGTIHELHGTAEHEDLYRNDSRAPEEEVRATIYNEKLAPVAEFQESSRALPPLLLDTGRVTLHHRNASTWYFRETLWNGEHRDFGTLTSSCLPQTSVLSGNMLLVIGCDIHSLNAWARVMRPDGSLVLRTVVHPSDLYPVAAFGFAHSVVLISPHLLPAANRDGSLHASDINGESIRVLRASDGRQQFATSVAQPTTSEQAAAVDSANSAIAILDGDSVHIFSLAATSLPVASQPTAANPAVHQPGSF